MWLDVVAGTGANKNTGVTFATMPAEFAPREQDLELSVVTRDTELHPDGVAQRGEVVQMVRLATHAMDFDGAVWHDEQAVRVVRAAVLGDHRRGPGMRRLQLLGNDVRTRDALSRISDDLRGADVHGRADVDDAPVLRFVQGYGMLNAYRER